MKDNPRFTDNGDILLIDIDDDYDDNSQYNTPDTSRIEETLFTQSDRQAASTVRLK